MNTIKLYPAQIWGKKLAIACLVALFITAISQIPVADHTHPEPHLMCVEADNEMQCVNLNTEVNYEAGH